MLSFLKTMTSNIAVLPINPQAIPALIVSLHERNPMMIYFGGSLGELGMDN